MRARVTTAVFGFFGRFLDSDVVAAEECPINWGVTVMRVTDHCFHNDSL